MLFSQNAFKYIYILQMDMNTYQPPTGSINTLENAHNVYALAGTHDHEEVYSPDNLTKDIHVKLNESEIESTEDGNANERKTGFKVVNIEEAFELCGGFGKF